MDALGIAEYIAYAPWIIRGLDYYTGTVFEAQAITADVRRSIAGGGRYDNLLADVGGESLPGVGFALGDMVLQVVLDELGLLPSDRDTSPAKVLVTVFSEDTLMASYQLSADLRRKGISVSTYPTPEKLGKQFKYADRIGAQIALVLGPEEIQEGKVAIKNLTTRDQVSVLREDVWQAIRDELDNGSGA